ncbi:uncharacterized protein TM35_000021700 [Trypanosoma theileri]|uniref:Uncharacterized protein n=1 Tax=Trypanosoma theileri TaxID=67003 RepID=A0A1X0P7D4_9TRYP|nr:uncharacterized protein TM35_000021700 [Trypanosoma theileri]ORC92844.1 hypothetical protein TM35_000021700 [Trypanosoma theileri]
MGQSSSNNTNSNNSNNSNNSSKNNCSPQTNHNNSQHTPPHPSSHPHNSTSLFSLQRRGGHPPVMIPAEPVNVVPTPLPPDSPATNANTNTNMNMNRNTNAHHLTSSSSSSSSWLATTEAKLTREWAAGRRRQQHGVAATSPHVPLTCAAASFPDNRTTAIRHPPADGEAPATELPVGKEFFLALRAAWREEAAPRDVLPPTDEADLDDSFIHDAIEDTVGTVLAPPVPLAYMVSEILVPQWELGGLYDAPAVRNNP